MTLASKIKHLFPCGDAQAWLQSLPNNTTPQQAWDECKTGSWMLWLIGRTDKSLPWSDERKPVVLCAMDCALLAKKHLPAKSKKEIAAHVATIRKWATGKATKEEAQEARRGLLAAAAAAAAAYAADAAAYAAYAADADARALVLAKCTDIVRKHYPSPPNV